ncbi:MAG TPA: GAF domain-containing protein, partial [Ktedonobacterales bacterium]|nr:GAF domain-containing protein [Ktedonobacterales bacterium]
RLRPRADDADPESPVTYLGLIGTAFLQDQTQRIQDIQHSAVYFARYPGVRRLIAAPMRRGYERVGVLDVETDSQRYYTVADRSWIEFFADRASSALNSVEIALSNLRQIQLKALLRRIGEGIAHLRAMDRHTIRDNWHGLRQELLDEIRAITGATKVTIFTAVDAYDADGNQDLQHGQLIEATSAPRHREKGEDRYYFSVKENLAGLVFQTQQRVMFNRRLDRPDAFAPLSDQAYEVKSGIALPIMEGARLVGVLQFDHRQSGFCTEENVSAAEEAAEMAGDILVSSRIRLDEIQVRYLRDYELDILSLRTPDTQKFMLLTLQTMRRISNVVDGWGQVTLIRRYRMDDGSMPLRIERAYRTAFGPDRPESLEEWPLLTGLFTTDHPVVGFELFTEVIQSGQMRLLPDALRLTDAQRYGVPWEHARAIISVPLIQPRDGEDQLEVFGILVVASRRSARFNDNDVSILSRMARSVVIGYRNLGLANAQKDILAQLTHDLSKALVPLTHRVEDLAETTRSL